MTRSHHRELVVMPGTDEQSGRKGVKRPAATGEVLKNIVEVLAVSTQ